MVAAVFLFRCVVRLTTRWACGSSPFWNITRTVSVLICIHFVEGGFPPKRWAIVIPGNKEKVRRNKKNRRRNIQLKYTLKYFYRKEKKGGKKGILMF
jgi:hypothetical protein